MIAPKGSLEIHEEAWIAYPYCRTVITVSNLVCNGKKHSGTVILSRMWETSRFNKCAISVLRCCCLMCHSFVVGLYRDMKAIIVYNHVLRSKVKCTNHQ